MRDIIDIVENADTRYLYHGTSTTDAAKSIIKNGLRGRETQGKAHLSPMAGRVYLTSDIRYAIIYALGGDSLGYDVPKHWIEKSQYGYVFGVDPTSVEKGIPDEDSVGEFYWEHSEGGKFSPTGSDDNNKRQLWDFIGSSMTPRQRHSALEGEYSAWAQGGKRALQNMPDWMKSYLIAAGAHSSHSGIVRPIKYWRIDKIHSIKLAKDGSNFFELAKEFSLK